MRVNSLEEAVVLLFGEEVRIVGRRPVYGGDINEAFRLDLSDSSSLFLKCNARENRPFFEAEAKGLQALRRAGAIGVPAVLGFGADQGRGKSFLLMEYLGAAPRIPKYWEVFGEELAALHRADGCALAGMDGGCRFGFGSDNYIGASPQINAPRESWIAFYRDCRLSPQMKMARRYWEARTRRQCEWLLDHLDSFLLEPDFPSLLHGDLWSGNAVCGPDGKAWIVDPAVYVGHFEAELAMTELFGGFPPSFYEAYRGRNPIDPGYRERRDLYQLYHLLNHLNLFGGSYWGAVKGILDRYAPDFS